MIQFFSLVLLIFSIFTRGDKVEEFLERDADHLAPTLDRLLGKSHDNFGYCMSLGACFVQGDKVIENGHARQLTECESALLKHYQQQMYRWRKEVQAITERFREAMCHVMDDNHCVMMEPFPPMPPVPCLCSNCNRTVHEKPAREDLSSANEAEIMIKPIIH